jgi:hypothetical protein
LYEGTAQDNANDAKLERLQRLINEVGRERTEDIKCEFDNGYTRLDIAEHYGLSVKTISKILEYYK